MFKLDVVVVVVVCGVVVVLGVVAVAASNYDLRPGTANKYSLSKNTSTYR
jgi:hypothetical protein